MPILHQELPLRLIDNRPTFALDLASIGGLELPPCSQGEVVPGDLIRGPTAAERSTDRAVLLRGANGHPHSVVVVELRRSIDDEIRRRWPGKVARTWESHGCDVYPLAICPDETVARWAAEPIVIGAPPLSELTVWTLAVSPATIPRLTDSAAVSTNAELSTLSAAAHSSATGDGLAVADAYARGIQDVLNDVTASSEYRRRVATYFELYRASVSAEVRRYAEETVDTRLRTAERLVDISG